MPNMYVASNGTFGNMTKYKAFSLILLCQIILLKCILSEVSVFNNFKVIMTLTWGICSITHGHKHVTAPQYQLFTWLNTDKFYFCSSR